VGAASEVEMKEKKDRVDDALNATRAAVEEVKDDLLKAELALSCCLFLCCVIGMSVGLAGISSLPKCRYGSPTCYFFVKVCDADLLDPNKNRQTCMWVPKNKAIEGSDDDGVESLVVPIIAMVLGLIPGLALVVSMVIGNERTLFALLEFSKMFCAFDFLLLIIACMYLNGLTWDCRWFSNSLSGNKDECERGYTMYIVGACFIFICEFVLLFATVGIASDERRSRAQDKAVFSGSNVSQRIQVGSSNRTSTGAIGNTNFGRPPF
jgi:hypothetical protein